jgi:hypothetical protein
VEFLNNFLGRYTDGTDKQFGLFLDNHVDQIVEFTLGVIVVCLSSVSSKLRD